MSDLLRELFVMYGQDFDIIFTSDTDPIDLFISQHTHEEQKQLLKEMRSLYNEIVQRTRTVHDIRNIGMEYFPNGNRSPEVWLPKFMKYLEDKTASKG